MNDLRLEVPRLDPLPFIVADVVLLGTAALIGWQASAPLGVASLAAITTLVFLGTVIALYPFVTNHARRQEEALAERSAQIEALARTLTGAAEQISIAVANLPAIAEKSARQLKAAEQLPAELHSRLADLQRQLSATASEENSALRHELDTLRHGETTKLNAALESFTRSAAELARLESIATRHSTALDSALAQFPRLTDQFTQETSATLRRETATAVAAIQAAATATTAAAQTHAAALPAPAAPAPATRSSIEPPPAPATRASAPARAPAAQPAPTASLPPPAAPLTINDADLDEPNPPSETAAPPLPSTDATDDAPSEVAAPPSESAASEGAEPTEAALSHDGYTRLVVTAYIGIGNKLFIRGDGPGLKSEKGAPLQFVSIGKWRWESAELLFPAKARLYKNDQIECTALGELTLEPGHHHEVNASF